MAESQKNGKKEVGAMSTAPSPAPKAKYNDSEVQEALKLLEQKRDRQRRIDAGEIKGASYKKRSEMTEEEKKKADALGRESRARIAILVKKAKDAGFTASKVEVTEYLLANPPKGKKA